MQPLKHIRGILFDLDGVLYVGSRVIDGAIETIDELKQRGYRCRFITNTSTLSLHSLAHKLTGLGFHIAEHEIISATQAAVIFLRQQPQPVCQLLLADDVKSDFAEFAQSESEANYIVVGDIGDQWSYRLLNNVFNRLMNGARLIAIHKNRFWQTEHGLQMDIGAFISALEYASQQPAVIIGKPSIDFFRAALSELQLNAEQTAIVGDDIDSDIGGGKAAGLTGILTQTGKYRKEYAEQSAVSPDLVVPSMTTLTDCFPKLE